MIDLLPSTEQQQIIDSVRQFLAARLPLERLLRQPHPAPYGAAAPRAGGTSDDLVCWPQIVDLGWLALAAPEAAGGVGLGPAEEALVCREYGRVLAPTALVATALAIRIALQAGDAALAQSLMAGRVRAAHCIVTANDRAAPTSALLVDAGPDDLLVTWTSAGAALHAPVPVQDRRPVLSFDDTVVLARAIPGAPLCSVPAEAGGTDAQAAVLLAAYQCGVGEAVRDMAVAYAQTREQFGQPIGAFQAIKHRCVDVAVAVEIAWAQTAFAALSSRRGGAEFGFQAASAMLVATRAAIDGAEANIQIHGGIGFTAELNAQALLKRAYLVDRIGGGMRHQQARILEAPVTG